MASAEWGPGKGPNPPGYMWVDGILYSVKPAEALIARLNELQAKEHSALGVDPQDHGESPVTNKISRAA